MFKTFFQKVGKAAFNTSQSHTNKQNFIKKSQNFQSSMNKTSLNFNIKLAFSSLQYQKMENNCLIERTTALGNAVALNLMNLRQILEKCKQQTQLQSCPSTTQVYDLVSMGVIDSNVLGIIDSCKTPHRPYQQQIYYK